MAQPIIILTKLVGKFSAVIYCFCYHSEMEKVIYTPDELHIANRDELIGIILSLQENIARMTENQELILEQIAILHGQRFGRYSEKMDVIGGQMNIFFNKPKPTASEPGTQIEGPEVEEVVIRRKKKQKGKHEDDLKGITVTVVRHEMSEDSWKSNLWLTLFLCGKKNNRMKSCQSPRLGKPSYIP